MPLESHPAGQQTDREREGEKLRRGTLLAAHTDKAASYVMHLYRYELYGVSSQAERRFV